MADSTSSLDNMLRAFNDIDFNSTEILDCVRPIRKALSKEDYPPIAAILEDADAVRKLVKCMDEHEDPTVRYESAWCLSNIASGTSEQCQKLMEFDAHKCFIHRLKVDSDSSVIEQCIWGTSNLLGDSVILRNMLLEMDCIGAVRNVHNNISDINASQALLENIAWSISNACRGQPAPELKYTKEMIPMICQLLQQCKTNEGKSTTLWAFSSALECKNNNTRLDDFLELGDTAHTTLAQLVKLAENESSRILLTPLQIAFGNLASGDEIHAAALIDAGYLVSAPANTLACSSVKIRKETCWALSNLTAGTPSQALACVTSNWFHSCIGHVFREDRFQVKHEAAYVLSNAFSIQSPEITLTVCCGEAFKGYIDFLLTCLADLDSPRDSTISVIGEGLYETLKVLALGGENETKMKDYMSKADVQRLYTISEDQNSCIALQEFVTEIKKVLSPNDTSLHPAEEAEDDWVVSESDEDEDEGEDEDEDEVEAITHVIQTDILHDDN